MNDEVNKLPDPLASRDAAKGPDQTMRRAEELVDDAGERIGHFASLVGGQLLRIAARAREEAEDIWVEAQSIRRRNGRQ